jgi:antitoxin (DNA-binding transcriptional repressor) of toxin-antitoxin stability system
MARKITQRELRNASGEIMRALDRGESFLVTRNGVAVGDCVHGRVAWIASPLTSSQRPIARSRSTCGGGIVRRTAGPR